MLNFLFGGLYDSLCTVFQWFIDEMIEIFSFTTVESLRETFPIADDFFYYFSVAGWGIMLIILAVTTLKSMMTHDPQDAENPALIAARVIPAGLVLAYAQPIIDYILDFSMMFYKDIINIESGAAPLSKYANSFMAGIENDTYLNLNIENNDALLKILLLLIMFISLISFLIEAVTRIAALFISQMLFPLLVPSVISKDTRSYFNNYMGCLAGHIALIWSNGLILKMVSDGLKHMESNSNLFIMDYIAILAMIFFGKQFDDLIYKLGFKNVRTGGLLMAATYAIRNYMGAVSKVAKGVSGIRGKSNGNVKPTDGSSGSQKVLPFMSAKSPSSANDEKKVSFGGTNSATASMGAVAGKATPKLEGYSAQNAVKSAANAFDKDNMGNKFLDGQKGAVSLADIAKGKTDGLYKDEKGNMYGLDSHNNRIYYNDKNGTFGSSNTANGIKSSATYDSEGNLTKFSQKSTASDTKGQPLYNYDSSESGVRQTAYGGSGEKVRSTYTNSEDGSSIDRSYSNGVLQSENTFDKSGNLISAKSAMENGGYATDSYSNGVLSSHTEDYPASDSSTVSSYSEAFGSSGEVVSSTTTNTDGSYINKDFSGGSLQKETGYDANGQISYVEQPNSYGGTDSSHYSDGKLLYKETTNPTGSITSYKETYNSAGAICSKTSVNSEGATAVTTYPKNGGSVVTNYDKGYNLTRQTVYNNNGNKTEKTVYNNSGSNTKTVYNNSGNVYGRRYTTADNRTYNMRTGLSQKQGISAKKGIKLFRKKK